MQLAKVGDIARRSLEGSGALDFAADGGARATQEVSDGRGADAQTEEDLNDVAIARRQM
jgi:hypothetical protein